MSFEQDFDAEVTKLLNYQIKVRNAAVLELGSKIIDDTPVLTGALKGSWKATVGVPSEDKTERLDGDGFAPKAELEKAIKEWPKEGSVFMVNHQHYSEGVEFDGYSIQKPAGMVRVNLVGRNTFADLTTGTGRVI